MVILQRAVLRIVILFFSAIYLAPPGSDHNTASASGPDPRFPPDPSEPDVSTYPSDDEIDTAFIGGEEDATVLFVDIEDGNDGAYKFKDEPGIRTIRRAFRNNPDGSEFIFRNNRPRRWYADFAERVALVYVQRAIGLVWLVSRWPEGPRLLQSCNIFWFVELSALKTNPDLRAIMLVDSYNIKVRRQYWPVPENPSDKAGNRDGNGGGNGDGNWPLKDMGGNRILGPGAGGAGGPGAGGTAGVVAGVAASIAAGAGLLDGFGLKPGLKDDEKKAGVLTDSFDSVVGQLTPGQTADDGGTGQLEVNNFIAGTDAYQPTSPLGVFGPALRPRDDCYIWGDPNNPDFPILPGEPDVILDVGTESIVPPNNPHPFPNAVTTPTWVGVNVAQYDKDPSTPKDSDVFRFDVRIARYDGTDIGGLTDVENPAGKPLIVWSMIPFAVYVWPGDHREDPLNFKYGEHGNPWDSSSQEHQCALSNWANGKREGYCTFNYEE